jgi:hypothetical protein
VQQVAFKLGYSLVVAILFILFVVLGTRTFYAEPEGPEPPRLPQPVPAPPARELEGPGPEGFESIFCEKDGRCFRGGRELTAEDEAQLPEEDQLYIQELREFQLKQQEFEQERADYHRNVFILAGFLGVAAIAAGLYLFRRVEAMPLGLMLGGLGVIIYGWGQAAEDFGEIGEAPLFAAASVGLAVVLAMGYWFLGARQPTGQD